MKIERIERSKHKRERVLVYPEGGAPIRITEDELLHFGLHIGLDISPEDVVQLQNAGARSETRVRAANMISARPLSKKELTRRLSEKGASERDAEETADWLESIGALDDAAYAAMLVRHYGAQGYGAARIRDELFKRGVPRALWDEALAGFDADESAVRFVHARLRGKTPDEREGQRLLAALQRRGFSWDEAREALAAVRAEIECEEESPCL